MQALLVEGSRQPGRGGYPEINIGERLSAGWPDLAEHSHHDYVPTGRLRLHLTQGDRKTGDTFEDTATTRLENKTEAVLERIASASVREVERQAAIRHREPDAETRRREQQRIRELRQTYDIWEQALQTAAYPWARHAQLTPFLSAIDTAEAGDQSRSFAHGPGTTSPPPTRHRSFPAENHPLGHTKSAPAKDGSTHRNSGPVPTRGCPYTNLRRKPPTNRHGRPVPAHPPIPVIPAGAAGNRIARSRVRDQSIRGFVSCRPGNPTRNKSPFRAGRTAAPNTSKRRDAHPASWNIALGFGLEHLYKTAVQRPAKCPEGDLSVKYTRVNHRHLAHISTNCAVSQQFSLRVTFG